MSVKLYAYCLASNSSLVLHFAATMQVDRVLLGRELVVPSTTVAVILGIQSVVEFHPVPAGLETSYEAQIDGSWVTRRTMASALVVKRAVQVRASAQG